MIQNFRAKAGTDVEKSDKTTLLNLNGSRNYQNKAGINVTLNQLEPTNTAENFESYIEKRT